MDSSRNGEASQASDGKFSIGRSRRGSLAFIFLAVFLDLLGMTLLIPVSVFLVRRYDTSATMIGLLTVVYAAAQFISAPILGQLSDRWGRRPLLVLSVLGSAVADLLFGLGGSIGVLILARLVDGITAGNLSIAEAYIADISKPDERTRNFAIIGIAHGLGFILGPVLGGLFGQIDIALPAFISSGLSLASALVGYFCLSESLPVANRVRTKLTLSQVNPFGAIQSLGTIPLVGGLLAVSFFFNFAFNGMISNLGLLAVDRFALSPGSLALLMVFGGVANLAVQGLVSKPGAVIAPPRRLLLIGLGLQILAYVGIGLVQHSWMLYGLYVLLCFGNALIFPGLATLLSNSVGPSEQGKLTGVNASLIGLTSILAPLWAGLAYDGISPATPYLSFGLLVLVAIWFLARSGEKCSQVARQELP